MLDFKEIEKKYNFDIEKIVKEIKKNKAKIVLLQFPDGLKQYSTEIVDVLSQELKGVEFRISLDSCFGACDIPQTQCNMLIQFGHAAWK